MTRKLSPIKFTHIDVIVFVFVFVLFLVVIQVAGSNSRNQEHRITCAKNLSVIARAMLLYANDYNGEFPRAGGRTTKWSMRIADWKASNRFLVYQMANDGTGGFATISSSLYLLVKYADVSPKIFVCPGDYGVTVFNPTDEGVGDISPTRFWDFGPHPSDHYSYAYHTPYCAYRLTTSSEPGMAVAADRNPWMTYTSDFPLFNPSGNREAIKAGNSYTHEHEGQNVLFVDGHVSFETESFCGVDNDNIYLPQNGRDIRIGSPPIPFVSFPSSRTDSFLVNEPGVYKETENKQSKTVKTDDLKMTSVVATLDSPMPEHRNVIWCSTFQMAWDKMKNDIIGEPIQVIGAEELAARLNQAKVSPKDLNEESYYAVAGFVEKGIIEEIKKEMAKRFPGEPIPVFSESYSNLPHPILAYSYLNVDVGFKYPFYTYERAFKFENSNKEITNVTAFCDQYKQEDIYYMQEDSNYQSIRDQVDILYYEYGKDKSSDYFAIDLCKHTERYQIILALVPVKNTLGELISDVENKISGFKNDENYKILSKLRPSDRLIVPDILYKLTHHLKELIGKYIGNPEWSAYFIFEAMQMIDFSLSRTGVILKSEARFSAAGGIGPRIQEPRYFCFNKPFLIYVKKRGDDFFPFFVMWVDNTELMKEFK